MDINSDMAVSTNSEGAFGRGFSAPLKGFGVDIRQV